MSKRPTLLQHFRSFAYQNNITNIDVALEYFSVFGGTGWDVNTTQSLDTLILKKVLHNYADIHNGMTRFTHNNGLYHLLLTIIALGVEHEDDMFKKARTGREKGEEAMDYLEMKSVLKFDKSIEQPIEKSMQKSDRLLFEFPFMRFWFATISPYYQSISQNNFKEFEDKWQEIRENFSILLSNQLVLALSKYKLSAKFDKDPIISIGSYYDKKIHIGILAKRKSGKLIAGACKYSKDEAKIHMLTTLKEKCEKAKLTVDEYVLFSKNGFTSEVIALGDDHLTLFTQKDLATLLNDLNKNDLLVYKNKKY